MDAYKHLRESGKISEREQDVLQWVDEYNQEHNKNGTAREIHEWLAVDKGNEEAQLNGPNYIKPRITELKDRGYIEEGEKRECSVTGRKAYEIKTVAKQETVVKEEDDIYVDEDGNHYVFNPNTDPDQEDDESSESLVSNTDVDEDSETCSTTDEDKVDDEVDSESTQTVLMQDGEVVG
jgi:hypothetical protein